MGEMRRGGVVSFGCPILKIIALGCVRNHIQYSQIKQFESRYSENGGICFRQNESAQLFLGRTVFVDFIAIGRQSLAEKIDLLD